ncbi:hypothetical protein [Petrotoga sp. DB-2]
MFEGGANSLIADKLPTKTLNQLKKYNRPILKTLSKTISFFDPKVLFYKDIKNGGIIEVWTKRLPIEVLAFDEKEQIRDINNA